MEIRTPLIAILVLGILICMYLRRNMPELISSRIYLFFLITAFVNVLCEIFECTVFIYLHKVYSVLRRLSQNFYIITLLITVFVVCAYLCSKICYRYRRMFIYMAIMAIPLLIAIGVVIMGEISYSRTAPGYYYSIGSAITYAYATGFAYIVVALIVAFIYRGRMRKDEFAAIEIGLFIWACIAIFQFYTKGVQIFSLAVMVMALILFISLENPKEFYEKNIPNVRNKDSFISMLAEYFGYERPFYIMSVIFTGKTKVFTGTDTHDLFTIQGAVANMASKKIGISGYLSDWNTLSFITKKRTNVETFMNLINNYKGDLGNYKMIFSVLDIPRCVKELDKTMQVLNFVSGEYVHTQSSPNLVVDQKIIDKMIYRNSIEDVVRDAIKNKKFEVYYQPILNVKDGSFSSAEALVRLIRPEGEEYISPEEFVPIAEKCGLIIEMDDLVFEKVCSFITREKISEYGIKTIEVNLSGNEAVDIKTHDRLICKMEKYNIPPEFINFEITDTSYINNDEVFKENVKKLKERGSTFSMDDFGSGYSNLLELLKMDYLIVKLDKEFVWQCLDSEKPENLRMLKHTINFLKDYGLHILAEGVETLEQAKELIDNGVEYLQGFYYSRPVNEADFIEFLKANERRAQ